MVRGWFVGDFEPAVHRTGAVEVGVKRYAPGDAEAWHYHKVATEITVVTAGRVRLGAAEFGPGDVVVIEPGEGTDFEALTDATTVVVKLPGARDDKYLRGE
jgi:quercetin dioxygenase-like cupin family protein